MAQCKANLVTALEKNGEEEEALKHFCTGFVEHVKPEHVSNLYSKFRALVEKMGPDSLSGILANYRARAKEHAADTDERKVLELRIQVDTLQTRSSCIWSRNVMTSALQLRG